MIEINLLPEDLRKRARGGGGGGSGRRKMVLGVALLVVAAIGAGYFHVAHVRGRQERHEHLSAALVTLQRETEEMPSLQSAIKRIERRKGALTDLYRERTLWAEKLDQLVDIVPENIWVRSIRLAQPRRRHIGTPSGGTFTLECYSAGTEEKGITLFRERLKEHVAFWEDVEEMNRIKHRVRDFPAYVEGEALDFTVDLQLKSRKPAAPTPPARQARTVTAGR